MTPNSSVRQLVLIGRRQLLNGDCGLRLCRAIAGVPSVKRGVVARSRSYAR